MVVGVCNNTKTLIQVLPVIYCGQEFGNGTMPNYTYSSMFYREMPRDGSPPWRPDDKDGHYVFAIGENLTPRCKFFLQFRTLVHFFMCKYIHVYVYCFFICLIVILMICLMFRFSVILADRILSKMGEGWYFHASAVEISFYVKRGSFFYVDISMYWGFNG